MRVLVYVVPIVLMIYCWVEIAQSDPRQVRQLTRGLWSLVVLIPIAGAIGWLAYGRPNGDKVRRVAVKPPRRSVGPDDDPEFLRSLRRPKPPEDSGPTVP